MKSLKDIFNKLGRGQKRLSAGFLAAAAIAVPGVALASDTQVLQVDKKDVSGFWLVQNKKAVVEVSEHEDGLHGNLYWIKPGGERYDKKNPDETLRNTPMCGLQIIEGGEYNPTKEKWQGGQIYHAEWGKKFKVEVKLKKEDRLNITGFLGPFPGTDKWKRVGPDNPKYPKCTPPPPK